MSSGRHALIIEDDALSALEVKRCLARAGFGTFAFAAAAGQALEQARLKAPDLVTVDLSLLDGDGKAAVQALRAEFGALRVIYITGSSEPNLDLAGSALVRKPFGERDVLDALERLKAA